MSRRFIKQFQLLAAMLIGFAAVLSIAPSAQAAAAPSYLTEVASNPAIIKVKAVNGSTQSGFARSLLTNEYIALTKSGDTLEGKATVGGSWRVTAIIKDASGNVTTKFKDVSAVPLPVVDIVDASVGSDTIDAFWSKTKGVEGKTIVFDEQNGPGGTTLDVSGLADGDGASFTVTADGVWCAKVISRVGTKTNTSVEDCAYFNAA